MRTLALGLIFKLAQSVLSLADLDKLNRETFMSAHVLLNLINELSNRDKMQGLSNFLSLFPNEFNKFNNTRVQMIDSIYHTLKSHFCLTTL